MESYCLTVTFHFSKKLLKSFNIFVLTLIKNKKTVPFQLTTPSSHPRSHLQRKFIIVM